MKRQIVNSAGSMRLSLFYTVAIDEGQIKLYGIGTGTGHGLWDGIWDGTGYGIWYGAGIPAEVVWTMKIFSL